MTQFTAEQLELQAHIQAENEKARAEGALFTTMEDLQQWAEYGVFNIEQYQHHSAVGTYIDVYKSINGIKPRWMDFSQMTTEQIYADLDQMVQAEERWEREKQEAEKKLLAERKHNNRYRPNNALAGLGELLSTKG